MLKSNYQYIITLLDALLDNLKIIVLSSLTYNHVKIFEGIRFKKNS
tara:strand:- start:590 stop:727 length:138 start_codon:yes stop_codon:yes gene_type:complete